MANTWQLSYRRGMWQATVSSRQNIIPLVIKSYAPIHSSAVTGNAKRKNHRNVYLDEKKNYSIKTQGKILELNRLSASCDCHGDSGCAQSLPVSCLLRNLDR